MTNSKLLITVLKGLLIYSALTLMWGILNYKLETLKFSTGNGIPNFWENLYFSCVTFGTIGYGDIIPKGFGGQLLTILQSMTSIIYVGIFSGYMAFQFLKRPRNILISDNILLRPFTKDILFSFRVGNKGTELVDCKLEIGFIQIKNDIKDTFYNSEFKYSLLEKSWLPALNLNKPENFELGNALKSLYHNPDNIMIRILINGSDINSCERVGLFKDYKYKDIIIAKEFMPIYNWQGLQRTKPNWSNFNKIVDLTQEQIEKVMRFLKE